MRKNDPFANHKFDKYEQEIEDSIDLDNIVEVPDMAKRLEEIAQYAKNTIAKDKRVSLRVNQQDLRKIQDKAKQNGLPYQTLINTLLHQYATGKIKINL